MDDQVGKMASQSFQNNSYKKYIQIISGSSLPLTFLSSSSHDTCLVRKGGVVARQRNHWMLCATNLAVRNDEFKMIITAIQQILTKSRPKSIKLAQNL